LAYGKEKGGREALRETRAEFIRTKTILVVTGHDKREACGGMFSYLPLAGRSDDAPALK
jgi:hypothetical protein